MDFSIRAAMMVLAGLLVVHLASGCAGKRVRIVTGTTVGLNATPGDSAAGQPPQVTLAYKRAELAVIPTGEQVAVRDSQDASNNSDAYSVVAAFRLATEWFGDTEVSSFIASGHAARAVIGEARTAGAPPNAFTRELSKTTLERVSPNLQTRRVQLIEQRASLSDGEVRRVLELIGAPVGAVPQNDLQNAIVAATSEQGVAELESAYAIARDE